MTQQTNQAYHDYCCKNIQLLGQNIREIKQSEQETFIKKKDNEGS